MPVARKRQPSVLVGTSGWHYRHWRGPFYPETLPANQMLPFYAQRFQTVELNTTFYRLPPSNAPAEWSRRTSDEFCFAAKGSRFITHMKKLRDPEPALERYFDHLRGLGKKLGPIVFQLPPQWPLDVERLAGFLSVLPRRRQYAFEFRNPTWNVTAVYDLLERYNVAYCVFDLAGFQSPLEVTADFTYVRLHGPGGKYQGSYDDRTLRQWAATLKRWRLASAYVYFDNDEAGYATKNAQRLRDLLENCDQTDHT
jgi:uncharacterized protein YecE (DUF72 family)